MSAMKSMKIDDFYNKGQIRADGRMIHDMYLFQVKSAKESTAPWDYYKVAATSRATRRSPRQPNPNAH